MNHSATLALLLLAGPLATAAEDAKKKTPVPTSFAPVVPKKDFQATMARMKAEKAAIEKKHQELLAARYDLHDDAAPAVQMARGKAVQQGLRARLLAWRDAGRARRDDAGAGSRKGRVARGIFPVAASESSRRRDVIPEV